MTTIPKMQRRQVREVLVLEVLAGLLCTCQAFPTETVFGIWT